MMRECTVISRAFDRGCATNRTQNIVDLRLYCRTSTVVSERVTYIRLNLYNLLQNLFFRIKIQLLSGESIHLV